jgi:hypothetical protein
MHLRTLPINVYVKRYLANPETVAEVREPSKETPPPPGASYLIPDRCMEVEK